MQHVIVRFLHLSIFVIYQQQKYLNSEYQKAIFDVADLNLATNTSDFFSKSFFI